MKKKIKFPENIFSLKNSKDKLHKIATIFGIKLSILLPGKIKKLYKKEQEKIKTESENLYSFLNHEVKPDSILYIEPNIDSHGEVMPYYIKYFMESGYNVDVIISPEIYEFKPFYKMSDSNFNVFLIDEYIRHIFLTNKVNEYKYIVFNSTILYKNWNGIFWCNIFEYIPTLWNFKDRLYTIEHHLELTNKDLLEEKRCICLANIPNISPDYIVANPHYFGNIEITPKNKITEFVMIGALEKERRNFKLLIDAIKSLKKYNKDFKITVIGRGKLTKIPKSIRKYINIKGVLTFPEMYEEMEKADFFLPLLDPENIEHNRYLTIGTSGSFQLIYGFLKPCLIQKKFADAYHFESSNSLVYEKNADLCKTMLDAINMSSQEYKEMQNNLLNLVKQIEKSSKNNLDKSFNNAINNSKRILQKI